MGDPTWVPLFLAICEWLAARAARIALVAVAFAVAAAALLG